MATHITMPQLGLTMEFGKVTFWYKAEGEAVKQGEELVSVETEKIDNTIEAPADGVVLKILVPEGDEGNVGDVLCIIGQPGEAVDDAAPAAEATAPAPATAAPPAATGPQPAADKSAGGRVKITPAAKKLAAELGVDYTALTGSDPEGRIIREDIRRAASANAANARYAQAAAQQSAPPPAEAPGAAAPLPYTGMRKRIGDNMSQSWALAPKVTHHVRADVTDLLALRANLNATLPPEGKLSVTDILVCILARTLPKHPMLNASLTEGGIVRHPAVHMGVAVALDDGLMVPVMRHAHSQGLSAVSTRLRELVAAARAGTLGLDDITGATFTLSNLGGYGSVDFFTPIINQPESAILGVGRAVEMPAVHRGEIAVRTMMGLSLAYDHRVVDGAVAAAFMADVLAGMANPLALLM